MPTCNCSPGWTDEHDPTCPIAKETPIPTMPRRERGKCVVSKYTSGPCEKCGKPQNRPHVTRDLIHGEETDKTEARLWCEACCPIHGKKEGKAA
jgi:hypothetical protein